MSQVQWFPGHMAKTKKQITEYLRKVDILIEVLDARAPEASTNPLLARLTENKPKIVLLNKDDLADPDVTKKWYDIFISDGRTIPIAVSASSRKGLDKITAACINLTRGARWHKRRAVRAMIAGIPNVGKSTIINSISRRRKAEAGATPGLTRDLRRIPVNRQLELFDTPGLLWHKFDDPVTGLILASLGALKETILPEEEVTGAFLSFMAEVYPERLSRRYKLENTDLSSHELVEMVGRRRGCLTGGGKIDFSRTSQIVLKDLREGRFGRITLEWPGRRGWRAD